MQKLFLVASIVAVAACGPAGGGGSSTTAIGKACRTDVDCGGSGRICATSAPGGYCTKVCTGDADCGTGAACDTSFCVKKCTADSSCRTGDGYGCVTSTTATGL